MYNFGVWSFWSFNIKLKVISKLPIFWNVSPFDFKFKFQNPVRIWKSVQYKTCRAWNSENFISWEFFKLLHDFVSNLAKQFDFKKWGELQYPTNHHRAPSGMGTGELPDCFQAVPAGARSPPWPRAPSSTASKVGAPLKAEHVVLFPSSI
jgi:hypothetical protein